MAAPGGQQSPENMPMPDMKGMWTMLIMMMMILHLHVVGKKMIQNEINDPLVTILYLSDSISFKINESYYS